jgi:hypothetical protein
VLMNELWILAHQDDEIFALSHFEKSDATPVICYLTKEVIETRIGRSTRMQEAKHAWVNLAPVEAKLISVINISADGDLPEVNLANLIQELVDLHVIWNFQRVISPTFEGGHQDHDMTFIIAKKLSKTLKIQHRHFSCYSGRNKVKASFRYFKIQKGIQCESAECASISTISQPAQVAILILKFTLAYRSQWRGLLGLVPILILNTLKGRTAIHTCAPTETYLTKPLYEIRNRYKSEQFNKYLQSKCD